MAEMDMAACASPKKRKAAQLWSTLRQVQRTTGCTNKTLKETFRLVQKFSGIHDEVETKPTAKSASKSADKELLRTTGAGAIRLDGCAGCNAHVFLPSHKQIFCPQCRHPRFNVKHKPNEVTVVVD